MKNTYELTILRNIFSSFLMYYSSEKYLLWLKFFWEKTYDCWFQKNLVGLLSGINININFYIININYKWSSVLIS